MTKIPELRVNYDAKGKPASPLLPEGMKNFLIDIDGTICEDVPNEQPERMKTCEEIPGAREHVNKWYDQGNMIYFFTSRLEEHREITETWLREHGFKWHGIIFGKPRGGNYHWIDDRTVKATRFLGKFSDFITVQKDIEIFKVEEEE
jgi:hypothetical protein